MNIFVYILLLAYGHGVTANETWEKKHVQNDSETLLNTSFEKNGTSANPLVLNQFGLVLLLTNKKDGKLGTNNNAKIMFQEALGRSKKSGRRNNKGSTTTDKPSNSKKDVKSTKAESQEETDFGCRDHNSKVNWFFGYKPPGHDFLQYSSNSIGERMDYFDDIRVASNPLSNTLKQFYDNPEAFLSFFWNDKLPHPHNTNLASTFPHSKNVLVCNTKNCFILHHSAPGFPRKNGPYNYDSSENNAQHYMCFTFPLQEAEKLFGIIYFINVFTYKNTIPSSIPNFKGRQFLEAIVNNQLINQNDKLYKLLKRSTHMDIHLGGLDVKVFYKEPDSLIFIWEEIASFYEGLEFDYSSWILGKDIKPVGYSEELKFYFNIATVLCPKDGREQKEWNCGKDHTKIAISRGGNRFVVCFSDVNFVKTEGNRSGMAFCIEHEKLWRVIRNEFKYPFNFKEAVKTIAYVKEYHGVNDDSAPYDPSKDRKVNARLRDACKTI